MLDLPPRRPPHAPDAPDPAELALLRTTVRAALARHNSLGRARDRLDRATAGDSMWPVLSDLGVVGLLVGEEHGGAGAGLAELCVVLEELGRGLADDGFVATSVVGATLLDTVDRADARSGAGSLLKQLAAGSLKVAVVASGPRGEWDPAASGVHARPTGDDELRLDGISAPILDGADADVLVVAATTPTGATVLAELSSTAPGVSTTDLRCLDGSRRQARLRFDDVPARPMATGPVVAQALSRAGEMAELAIAADLVGVGSACLEMAVEYAGQREAFGRAIGSYQAIKHRCADIFVAVEAGRSVIDAAVDAARRAVPLVVPSRVAKAVCSEMAPRVADQTIHIHGGIGYTWEHDAHLYYRRAHSAAQLFGDTHYHVARIADWLASGDPGPHEDRGTEDGGTEDGTAAMDADGDSFRARVRRWIRPAAVEHGWLADPAGGLAPPAAGSDVFGAALLRSRHAQRVMHEAGLAALTYPVAYGGQGLSNREQVIFNEETASYNVPITGLSVGLGMCAPTLLALGTDEQKTRYLPPLLRGDEIWCQLFSEPAAGSDVAGIQTRAERVGDSWVVNGQKVWTTFAHLADFGILLARTDRLPRRHDGLTMFILDMRAPGVTVRPLRQMNGEAHFNEVFIDDVVLGDADVLGDVGNGWAAALVTLANERVSIGAGRPNRLVPDVAELLDLARRHQLIEDPAVRSDIAEVYLSERVVAAFGSRLNRAILTGRSPGPEGSAAKFAYTEHARRSVRAALRIAGPQVQAWDPDQPRESATAGHLLVLPNFSIAGGTDEILKNVIGERILGLPKEPVADRRSVTRPTGTRPERRTASA